MDNDDKPGNWVEQIGDKVPVNDDIDKQHGRTLGKLESAATSRPSKVPEVDLEEDKYKGIDKEAEHKNIRDFKNTQPDYDQDAHEKNLAEAEAEAERDRRAIKDYENRTSKVRVPEPDQVDKNLLNRVNSMIDKASPYVDDITKGLGTAARVLGPISGVIGFLNPESTAEDDVFWKTNEERERYLKEQELYVLEHSDNIDEPGNTTVNESLVDKLNNYHDRDERPDEREQNIDLEQNHMTNNRDYDLLLDEYSEEMDGPDFGDFD